MRTLGAPVYDVGRWDGRWEATKSWVTQVVTLTGSEKHTHGAPWTKHSQDVNFYAFLESADRIKFHVVELQERIIRKTDIRRPNDGTVVIRREKVPPQNVGGVGFLVHLSTAKFRRLVRDPLRSHGHSPSSTNASRKLRSSIVTHRPKRLMNTI